MGKKPKKVSNPGADAQLRMNFLYQAAHILLMKGYSKQTPHYLALMKRISKRRVLPLSAEVKRTICRQCFSLLVPGMSMRVRVNEGRTNHVLNTCTSCHCTRRFINAPKKSHADDAGNRILERKAVIRKRKRNQRRRQRKRKTAKMADTEPSEQ